MKKLAMTLALVAFFAINLAVSSIAIAQVATTPTSPTTLETETGRKQLLERIDSLANSINSIKQLIRMNDEVKLKQEKIQTLFWNHKKNGEWSLRKGPSFSPFIFSAWCTIVSVFAYEKFHAGPYLMGSVMVIGLTRIF